MLRHYVQSRTGEGTSTPPRLTFFFLKAEPPAASLPAFLLLLSAISVSAVVTIAIAGMMSLNACTWMEISLPPTCCGLGPAMQG